METLLSLEGGSLCPSFLLCHRHSIVFVLGGRIWKERIRTWCLPSSNGSAVPLSIKIELWLGSTSPSPLVRLLGWEIPRPIVGRANKKEEVRRTSGRASMATLTETSSNLSRSVFRCFWPLWPSFWGYHVAYMEVKFNVEIRKAQKFPSVHQSGKARGFF